MAESEHETGVSLPPAPRVGRLKILADIRTELGRVYRAARRGEISTQDMTRFAYTLSVLGKLIVGDDLVRRVEQLEKQTFDTPDQQEEEEPIVSST